MRKRRILSSVLAILLIVGTPCFTNQAKAETAQRKILLILEEGARGAGFASAVPAYGETTMLGVWEANTHSIEMLREFDLFATYEDEEWGKHYGLDLINRITTLVDEGKSLIVVQGQGRYPHPASGWVSPGSLSLPTVGEVEYEIVPSNLTYGVRSIKSDPESVGPFLMGGYPLVLTPNRTGFPQPQEALAVHGNHGNGKYAVLTWLSFNYEFCRGDMIVLFSNLMYWLTNREFPGVPPSVLDTTAPTISILSPENKTYNESDAPLVFTIDESALCLSYGLDGEARVAIDGNTTITGLSDGSHTLAVYVKDFANNTGTSETVYFCTDSQQPPPEEPFLVPLQWLVTALIIVFITGSTTGFVLGRTVEKKKRKAEA